MNLIWVSFYQFTVLDNSKRAVCTGNLKTAVKALLKAGVLFSEIEVAVSEMEQYEHNFADFGVWNKSFIYSEYKAEYDVTKASA